MKARDVFEELGRCSESVARPMPLPTEEQVAEAEKKLQFKFPPSYRLFQLEYSNVDAGRFEPLVLTVHGDANLLEVAPDLVANANLPGKLFPFMNDDGDLVCFDLESDGPEYRVVLWCGDTGTVIERWDNFVEWVRDSWIPQLQR